MESLFRSCAVVGALSIASFGFAQSTLDHPVGTYTEYAVDSGAWAGVGDDFATVYSADVATPGASWLRLYFGDVQLEGASFVRMTSLLDGEQQALDAAGLAMWSYGSAYFNGNAVLLELVAAPGTTANRITLRQVAYEPAIDQTDDATTRGGSGQCGICGTDDRAPSAEDWSCRLMPVGCTASVYTSKSCLVSAGHCIQAGLVAQFHIPASQSNCNTVNPPVADQFPVTGTDSQNAGVGADWSVLTTGTNSSGQRAFQRYGKLRRLAPVLAAVGNPVSIWGFGVDLTCTRSQTQQLSTGAVTFRDGNHYEYNADVRPGNSGSGLLKDNRIIAIVTHCSTGCPNFGTRVDLAAFVAGRNTRCPACVADVNGDGVIDLGDLTAELGGFGVAFPDPSFDPAFDLNGDNSTDLGDLTLLLAAFGVTCP
jgi:V8-like Glu-specific endopeptidase